MADRDLELHRLPGNGGGGGRQASIYNQNRPGTAAATADRRHPGIRGQAHRFVDSFRREDGTSANNLGSADFQMTDAEHPHPHHHHYGSSAGAPRYYDVRSANAKTASSLLSRELKGRHLQMIAIGGSIGTGLFVASGKTLSQGGPASVLLAYTFIGVMLYCTVQALGEMAVVFPVAGSFSAFSTRFIDPSWGFAMGWK